MREIAQRLAAILVEHHKDIRGRRTPDTITPDDMLPYKQLCRRAGMEELTRTVGGFLYEIAEHCHAHGLPPLNSLAINREEKKPGHGYDGAPGCSEIEWWKEVKSCVAYETSAYQRIL
jgi:hypothetical protein